MRKHNWMLITLIFLILAQSLAATSISSASLFTGDWTTFRHDPNHSGYATGNGTMNSAVPLWNYTTGHQ